MWNIQEITDNRHYDKGEKFDSIEKFVSMTFEGTAKITEIDSECWLIEADGFEFMAFKA